MSESSPKNPRDNTDDNSGTMGELFDSVGLGRSTYEVEKSSLVSSSFKNLSSSIGMVCLAALMAMVVVVAAFVPLAFTASAAEPAVSWYKELPTDLPDAAIAERNVIFDQNGDSIAEFWVEDRILLEDLDEVSDYAIDALIATEDRRFYEHGGFDVRGIARSALSGSGGGSGITQQLVKNLQFYDRSRTEEERLDAIDVSVQRKIQELRYSIAYEEDHSKDEILLEYFNIVSFGGPDVYSIESAAQFFFGKSAADLSLAEASVLVGSVQNTSLFDLRDSDNEENYKARQAAVLDSMVATGDITADEASEALEEDLDIQNNSRAGGCSQSDYPFFCEYVIEHLRDDPSLGEDQEARNAVIAAGGLRIDTTLDPDVNDELQEAATDALGNTNRVTLPMAVVEPGTGAVKGFGFNREYGTDGEDSTEINLADNPTGTGSTFKMFTLAAALNNGFNENSLAFSSACPWTKPGWDTPDQGIGNSVSCELQGGYKDYLEATALSSNTWFVELQSRVGIAPIEEFATSVGLETPEGQGVGPGSTSYTLGPQGHSPIDVAAAYATFAAEGVYCPPTPVTAVQYADGTSPRIPDSYDPAAAGCQRVMSPHNAGVVLKSMQANMDEDIVPGAFGADAAIDGYDAVGKSGTNQLTNQAWAMLSSQYSLYANAYDFELPSREIDGYFSDGETRPWNDNTAQRVGSRAMEALLEPLDNEPLNYDSGDYNLEPVPVPQRDYVSVPSAIGMEPEAALSVFQGSGLTAHISKEQCNPGAEHSNRFPAGVIVGQSVDPGETLPRGTDTEIILCSNR